MTRRSLLLVLTLLSLPSDPTRAGGAREDRRIAAACEHGVRFLVSMQREDGSFRVERPRRFSIFEHWHKPGMYALAGLAILARRGWCDPVRRTVEWMLRNQDDRGQYAAGPKGNLEHGYCVQLMSEVLLALGVRDRRLGSRILASLYRGVAYVLSQQLAGGAWPYGNGRSYRETATAIPLVEGLLVVRQVGIPVPEDVFSRLLAYLEGQRRPHGFLNGEREQVGSPHMTRATLAILHPLRSRAAALPLIRHGEAQLGVHELGGYFRDWGFEKVAPDRDRLHALKVRLGARRHLYGLYYTALVAFRRPAGGGRMDLYRRVARHLLAHRTARGTWNSTAAEIASTALAVLALETRHGRLRLFRLGREALGY